MRGLRMLFFASWVILVIVLGAITLLSLQSIWLAYTSPKDNITPTYALDQVREAGGEDAAKAIRGRRATAATWALGYALLGIAVVFGPYRRGERWAWWALFVSLGLSQLLSLARAAMLGTTFGLSAPAIILALGLLGLLAGAPRIFRDRADIIAETEVR
jgi:hypothetical protein